VIRLRVCIADAKQESGGNDSGIAGATDSETLTREINQEENHGKSETEKESGEEDEAQRKA
jgi:hypothetical protein